ncbi:MAG: HVO_0476 family zinc finger protein [Candidatus Methanoperedens sp.]
MDNIEAGCPACSPEEPVPHTILKDAEEMLLQCDECGSIHRQKKETKEKEVPVRVIISKDEESFHRTVMLSGRIETGEELLVDDEVTGEANLVEITSIEVGDKRKASADARDIKTIWARATDEVTVKIAVNYRETTDSIEMKVPGDREYVVGDKITVNNKNVNIVRIKIRDGGFKSRKGSKVLAKYIKRIYCQPGMLEPRRISRTGGRVVVKKRESVWSLKSGKES